MTWIMNALRRWAQGTTADECREASEYAEYERDA
jgi:hypothetical protein